MRGGRFFVSQPSAFARDTGVVASLERMVAPSLWLTDPFRRLNTPVVDVVGAKTAKALAGLAIETVWDLVRHVPRRYLRGSESSSLTELPVGETVAIVLRVDRVQRRVGRGGQERLEATLIDDQRHSIVATWFARKRYLLDWWEGQLAKGDRGLFIGRVGEFRGVPQFSHPSFTMFDATGAVVGRDDPDVKLMIEQVSRSGLMGIYPQTSKISTWQISQAQQLAMDFLAGMPEPLPDWALDEANLPTLERACLDVHLPDELRDANAGIRRLRFDEALALQVTMAMRRRSAQQSSAPACPRRSDGLLAALDARLPFALTEAQQDVSEEIFADLARPHPMQRLLQGDVGSGKTVVALRAMAAVVDAGHQAALLVPTEVLARQHFSTIQGMLGPWGQGRVLGAPEGATEPVLLVASLSAAAKREALLKIASGEAGIIVGTHALLADRVEFADLGLVVVDEQHRFGVRQRSALTQGDVRPHELVMTATPIPRSLAMTVFGDLAVSSLTGVPGGREPVQTTVVNLNQHPRWLQRAWQRVAEEVAAGRQAFIVCPRISDSDADPLEAGRPSATVEATVRELTSGPLGAVRVAALHSRMAASDKDDVMGQFAAGEVDVLVATTVIEVGIDVPNATVMVVLDADRFGVAQLHQLRGRIGRGEHAGLCLLVTSSDLDSPAAERLAAVAATTDGFELAELDLAQRREGNLLGDSQSGNASALRLLRVVEAVDDIQAARDIAEKMVEKSPDAPEVRDMVTMTQELSAEEWLERT